MQQRIWSGEPVRGRAALHKHEFKILDRSIASRVAPALRCLHVIVHNINSARNVSNRNGSTTHLPISQPETRRARSDSPHHLLNTLSPDHLPFAFHLPISSSSSNTNTNSHGPLKQTDPHYAFRNRPFAFRPHRARKSDCELANGRFSGDSTLRRDGAKLEEQWEGESVAE